MAEKLIISKQRVKDFGEVYTPSHIVKQLCDLVQDHCFDDEATFLEPTCGIGNFLVEILNRKLSNIVEDNDDDEIMYGRMLVALGSIYGIDILKDNIERCKERLFTLFKTFAQGNALKFEPSLVKIILDTNIRQGNVLEFNNVFCRVSFDDIDNKITLKFYRVDLKQDVSNHFLTSEFSL